MSGTTPAIIAENLHKRYGGTVAVDDVSLHVEAGAVLGVLGTNGAGKTTTVEMIGACAGPTAAASASSAWTPGATGRRCARSSGSSCSRHTCTAR